MTTEWNARPKHWSLPEFRGRMHPVPPSALFSPIFSRARETIGPLEARQKRPRRNEPPQATSLFLCARFFLSKPQAKLAVWVFVQICGNLSVSAAPSQHPYPFCPFGTFPPDRGNRPLVPKGSLLGAVLRRKTAPLCQRGEAFYRSSRILFSSRIKRCVHLISRLSATASLRRGSHGGLL